LKFIHISDVHLIDEHQPNLYGVNPYFRLEKAFESIKKEHSDAKFIVLSGDLCDNASDFAYGRLFCMIENLPFEVYPILGNHDKKELFLSHFSEFEDGGFVQYVKNIDDKAFIFLDTSVENQPYGQLCQSRLKWLENQLKIHKKKDIYLFMHHHPVNCGLYVMDNFANFKTSKEFWRLLGGYKNVKHISFGHIHRIFHATKNGVSLHSTRGTAFQVAYTPNEKKEYLTNEENPTYAIVDIQDDSLKIHHHEYLNEDRVYLGDC
jgi:3',5'-cyclic AMP phosphodiesterase CpdA